MGYRFLLSKWQNKNIAVPLESHKDRARVTHEPKMGRKGMVSQNQMTASKKSGVL